MKKHWFGGHTGQAAICLYEGDWCQDVPGVCGHEAQNNAVTCDGQLSERRGRRSAGRKTVSAPQCCAVFPEPHKGVPERTKQNQTHDDHARRPHHRKQRHAASNYTPRSQKSSPTRQSKIERKKKTQKFTEHRDRTTNRKNKYLVLSPSKNAAQVELEHRTKMRLGNFHEPQIGVDATKKPTERHTQAL